MATTDSSKQSSFSRSIPTWLLCVYGLGTILGAGIYVVIGDIIAEAGALAPFSFLLSGIAAALTAFSYGELGPRIPESGGSASFVAHGFKKRWLTIIVGWSLAATGLASAATIITGFVGYLDAFVSLSKWWVIPGLAALLTLIAAIGVKQSAWFMGITTGAGISGLVFVAYASGENIGDYPSIVFETLQSKPVEDMGKSILLGSFLAFYSFIGFEDLVTLSEEAQDQKKALPLAIYLSLSVSLAFYILISIVALSSIDKNTLTSASAPLVRLVQQQGYDGRILAGLSLAIIVNGALAQLVMASRVVHDLGTRRQGAPAFLSRISQTTKTPLLATILGGVTITLLAVLFPTSTLARITSYIILIVFTAANASLCAIKIRGSKPPEGTPQVPMIVPILGVIVNIAMIVAQTLVL